MQILKVSFIAAAFLCTACGDSPDPIAPTNAYLGSIAAESFRGTLPVGGSIFYSFTSPNDGPISLTLLELTVDGVASDVQVSVSLGRPAGTGCSAGTAILATAGSVAQISGDYGYGVYCALISDPGNLTAAARFNLNITHTK